MGDINKLVRRMRYWCDEANLGYDQWQRWDIRPGGECDCSSLTIHCLKEAGFDVGTATYTGNMRVNLTARGWVVIKPDGHPHTGDILLADAHHVAVCTGPGILSQASRGESGHRVHGGASGDQDNYETNTRSYYDYPWDCYLRWAGKSVAETQVRDLAAYGLDQLADMVIEGKFESGEIRRRLLGNRYEEVQERVNLLLAGGKSVGGNDGALDVDGDLGRISVHAWQVQMGTTPDSVITGQDAANKPYVRNVCSMSFSAEHEGSELVRAIQAKVHVKVDGLWGHDTTEGIQIWLNSEGYALDVDGLFGPQSAMGVQRSINAGLWA